LRLTYRALVFFIVSPLHLGFEFSLSLHEFKDN